LIDADISIGNKRTPRQDAKSNVAQDDKQHNTALRRQHHKKTQKKKLDICENHLFRLKEKGKKREKRCQRVILYKTKKGPKTTSPR